ncbi:MAG: hypothetical protein PHV63_00725 [Candidatus Daviesbacteria bacterium]|nr:hypothetical protein [Candidatus Daviesbacteria bacterium]
MDEPLIVFNPKLPRLSKNEGKVLKLLVEAGKSISPLYLEQEKQIKKNSLIKEEINKASKTNAAILSPYTVLEKIDGKIVTIPYHVKYAKLLRPIADKLSEAASITDDKDFGKVLQLQAKALLDGSYDKATIAWLKFKPYILDIQIGPVAYNLDDQIFHEKAPYQAWVGVMDTEGTKRLNNYKTIVLGTRRKAMSEDRIDNYEKVRARVNDVILFSGFMARMKFVGINLPMDLNIVERYGSQITLFNQSNDLRMKEIILPTFNQLFSSEFREGFELEDLRRGYLRATALHELAHSFLYYKHASENLKDLFPAIYELAATILGMRMAGSLLLKERITEKMLESMIITFLCRSLYYMKQSKVNNPMINYVLGGSIFVNSMLESGALNMIKGMAVVNFMKMFLSLHELSDTLEHLLSFGTYIEAENFVKKYT